MLKYSQSRFAAAALGTCAIVVGPPALAQFTQKPALPRQDTVRTQDDELAQDSRAGGALAPETPPGGVEADFPEIVAPSEAIELDADRLGRGGTAIEVGENRLVLSFLMPGPAEARALEFKVPEDAKIRRNGKPAELSELRPGDIVKIETAPGNRDLAVAIVAEDQSEGSFNVMENDPGLETDDIGSEDPPARPVAAGGEEAVLPLGVEVYAVKNAALVTEMSAGGPAARAGVRIGDLILAINGTPIANAEKIEEFLARSGGRPVLTIQRGQKRMNVSVSPVRAAKNALIDRSSIQRALGGYGFGGVPVTINPGGIGAGAVVAPRGFVGGGEVAPAGANVESGAATDLNVPRNDFRSPGASPQERPAGFRSPGAPETGGGNSPAPQIGTNAAPATSPTPATGQ